MESVLYKSCVWHALSCIHLLCTGSPRDPVVGPCGPGHEDFTSMESLDNVIVQEDISIIAANTPGDSSMVPVGIP